MAAGEEILRDRIVCSKAQKYNKVCSRAEVLGAVAPEVARDWTVEDLKWHAQTFQFWVMGIITLRKRKQHQICVLNK